MQPNAYQRFSPEEDLALIRMDFAGERDKVMAYKMGRSPSSVNNRLRCLRAKLEKAHGDVLKKHRQEELALLEKLLIEAQLPEVEERR